jgi:hypothetical protein
MRLHRRVALLLAGFALLAIGPIVTGYSAQPASRYALTASLAEHGTVDLFHDARILGVDHALYDGRLRSDKPPLQPILGVPVYWAGRMLGLHPASTLRTSGDLGLWWQTLWSAMVPFGALLALMYVTASRYAARAALPATLALGFGTIMLPHAASLYGHTLAALFAYASWCVLDRRRGTASSIATAGLFAAAAVAVEYHTGFAAVVVFAVALAWWGRRALWFLVGAIPPVAIAAVYQWRAFGHPWRLPYGYYAGKLGAVPTDRGGYSVPSLHALSQLLWGSHGLLLVSPIVVVALVGAVMLARTHGSDARMHAIVALAIFVPYFLLIAGWAGTPLLEEPGPRYLIPALPFLCVPLALTWQRLRRYAVIATAYGVAVMVPATVTLLLVGPNDLPLRVYLSRVIHGHFNPTLWSMAFGDVGAVVYVALVAAGGLLLLRAYRRSLQSRP